jgi:dTMP kinase
VPDYKNRPPLSYYKTALPGVDYSELQGKLIVLEGPDAVGRSTQMRRLKPWLEEFGYAVLDTGLARSALAGKGIKEAKEGNTLGPITMTLFYATDFADRLENEIIPALRAGFVVLTDRYIFSIIARAIARGQDKTWIERTAGFAVVPHAVFYLRATPQDLISRVVLGRGSFDYWESGLDTHFGKDMYESFVKYQSNLIQGFESMVDLYGFQTIDASRSADHVFESLKTAISKVLEMPTKPRRRTGRRPAAAANKTIKSPAGESEAGS